MVNIFLVGFMGAGKSSVGRALAERLDREFVDLDERLCERFGCPVAEVFASRGETEFRAAEADELAAAAARAGLVVALGGGAFSVPGNRRVIEAHGGVSVFLDVPWPELGRRLRADHDGRPMYSDEASAERLWRGRLPDYRRADVTVALTGAEPAATVALRIAEALERTPCAT